MALILGGSPKRIFNLKKYFNSFKYYIKNKIVN